MEEKPILRVIAGKVRGLLLRTPKGMKTRPTTDRVKENLFNIIRQDISDAVFLDLFSGTGSLGIEALSRGALKGIFVDKNLGCIKIIKENLEHTKLSSRAEVYCADFKVALKKLHNTQKFSIIFLDPPYDTGSLGIALSLINEFELLEEDGLIVVERSKTETLSFEYFIQVRDENYGNTNITLLKNRNKILGN